MFYLGVVLIVLSVFAVSSLAMQGILPPSFSFTSNSFTSNDDWIWLVLLLVVFLLWMAYQRLVKIPLIHATKDGAVLYPSTIIAQCLMIFVLIVLFCAKTLSYFERFYAIAPTSALTVTAQVRISEISDGVYDAEDKRYYRQKAVLSDIKPVQGTAGTTPNPFYNPALPTHSSHLSHDLPKQMTVLLSTGFKDEKHDTDMLGVGTSTKMTLSLTPLPDDPDNDMGFNSRRYLMTRHIHANARILHIDSPAYASHVAWHERWLIGIQSLRQSLRHHFKDEFMQQAGVDKQSAGVVLSLLTGDRAFINQESKALYQWAGISHLLAISGAHVLFLAMLLTKLTVLLVNRYMPSVYYHVARWQLCWLVMLVSAGVYALFVGGDVPAMRTVYFLLAMGLLKWLLVDMSVACVLMVVGLAMIFADPMSIWQAGFWLSFVAVWLLMQFGMMDDGRMQTMVQLIKMQLYLFLAMLPISMLLFAKVSIVGMVSNLFMVGLFGYVIVPINLLAGILYGILPNVADVLWRIVIDGLAYVHYALMIAQLNMSNAWLVTPISVTMIAIGFLMIVMFKSPWLHNYWLILPLLMMIFGIYSTKHKADGLYLLPSNFGVWQTLIVKENHYWLVMSSDGKARLLDDKLAEELLLTLKRFGVRHLTGVVVQQDHEKLAYAVGRLSLQLPIEQFWFAGKAQRFGNITARACVMDKIWQQQGLTIRALTGWQSLDNPNMRICQLWIGSEDGALPIHADGAMLNWLKQPKQHDGVAMAQGVVIEAKSNQQEWALWRLLCRDTPKVALVIGQNMNQGLMKEIF